MNVQAGAAAQQGAPPPPPGPAGPAPNQPGAAPNAPQAPVPFQQPVAGPINYIQFYNNASNDPYNGQYTNAMQAYHVPVVNGAAAQPATLAAQVTHPKHMCRIHDDRATNSRRKTSVQGASVLLDGKRISLNCQHKASADSFCDRVVDSLPLMDILVDYYINLPEERKRLSCDSFDGPRREFVSGFPCVVNKPNIDPASYSQAVIDSCVRLASVFNLTYPEIVSVAMAWELVPNQTYFFRIASCAMLHHGLDGVKDRLK